MGASAVAKKGVSLLNSMSCCKCFSELQYALCHPLVATRSHPRQLCMDVNENHLVTPLLHLQPPSMQIGEGFGLVKVLKIERRCDKINVFPAFAGAYMNTFRYFPPPRLRP